MPHTTYDVLFNTAPVYNIRSMGYNDSAQIIIDRASGQADPAKIYLGNMEPIVSLQTTDILSVLGLNSGTFVSSGLCVTGATTTIPLARRADCSVLMTGGSHTAFIGNSVIVIPTQFEVRQDSEEGATCSLEVRYRSSDGIVPPATVSITSTLTTSVHALSYGLGRAYLNGTEFQYLTGLVINPGIQLLIQRTGGGIYPTAHYIQFREPTIDIMVENVAVAADFKDRFDNGGSEKDITPVSVFFRARRDGSSYQDDATAAHLKFSFAKGLHRLEALDAAQSGNGSATIRCHGKSLVSTTGVAIA